MKRVELIDLKNKVGIFLNAAADVADAMFVLGEADGHDDGNLNDYPLAQPIEKVVPQLEDWVGSLRRAKKIY